MSLRLTQGDENRGEVVFRLCHKSAARSKVFSPCSPVGTIQPKPGTGVPGRRRLIDESRRDDTMPSPRGRFQCAVNSGVLDGFSR